MVFTSATFLFLFFPIVLLIYSFVPKKFKQFVFLLSSFAFYGFWRLDFILLLLFSIGVDYFLGHKIYLSKGKSKKDLLFLSVGINLGLLCYFKYFNFGIDSLNYLLSSMDMETFYFPQIILPLGISFFTFQTMSYSIDIYRGEIKPSSNILNFATYVSMFPQLVAGPIVRYKDIEKSITKFDNSFENYELGLNFFILGFCKKVFIANNMAPIVQYVFSLDGGDTLTSIVGVLAYSFQIYFDFSGYSDMAIGLGYFFGFRFPINFNSPYKATSVTDFWRRWHISLSSWFRDYLYIPLGGNKVGPIRTYLNLSIVMVLCGAWHGAKWTFIIWGIGHGFFLILERLSKQISYFKGTVPKLIKRVYVIFIAFSLWIPFRAESYEKLKIYIVNVFSVKSYSDSYIYNYIENQHLFFLILAWIISFHCKNSQEIVESKYLKYIGPVIFILAIHEMLGQSYNPFLYFNF